ncbi:hypothetical protein GDO81_026372 [Engystomops pustulosus]|uniref:PARP catalytic domain-containing protein n=1 Tax=Engystomops pustulosus TaxID=76066 RepID=A0AAV6YR01_ENGPU|nr:hypothetical protein GDO81_026372 [Engystomops pustulosus]
MACKVDFFPSGLGGSLPSTWTFEESWTREVDPRSRDFEDRRKEFQQAGLTLLKMEKVQNQRLANVFQHKKEAVERREGRPSTQHLYQLVPAPYWRDICKGGFHRIYATPTGQKSHMTPTNERPGYREGDG